MRTRIDIAIVLVALAAVDCGKGSNSQDAAIDGNGGGGAGSSGGAGRGGSGGGAAGAAGDTGGAGRGGASGAAGDGGGSAGQGGAGGVAGRGGVGGAAGDGGGSAGQGGTGGVAARGGAGGRGGSGGSAGQGGTGGTGGSTCGNLGQPCCPGAGGGTCLTGFCVALAGPPICAAPSGGNGGGAGRGGAGGGGGTPAGVSTLGCTFGGGIDRVVVSKRDTAANQCLSIVLMDGRPATQSTPGLDLPAGWQLERATVGPAASCPTRFGAALAGQITGTIGWADLRDGSGFPAHANVDVTVTSPANDGGATVSDRIENRAVDVTPSCDSTLNSCSNALPIRCGDRLNHSTVIEGRPNMWSGYSRTARGESGRETIYAFASASTCAVTANLKNLAVDLDLLLLSTCDPISGNLMAASTPLDLQTVETVSWTNLPDQIRYLVVDGYNGAEGGYTLELDCSCQ